MAGYAFNMGQGNSPLTLDPMAEMQQAHAQAQQSKLAKLLGTAANAGAGADYSQANLIDPAATQAFQKNQSGMQDDRFKSTVQRGAMAAAAWKAGNKTLAQSIYTSIVPDAHAIAPGFNLPPEMDDSAAAAFDQLASMARGPQENKVLSPGGMLVDPQTGRMITQAPFAPEKPQNATLKVDAQGRPWWLTPGQAPVPADATAQAAGGQQGPSGGAPGILDNALTNATTQAGQPFYSDVTAAIAPYGAKLTSTDGGQHNAGSLHPQGRAVDIGMGASATPQVLANADRIIADMKARGYVVRDERTRPAGQAVWGGPHLHVELPQGGGPQQVASAGPRFPVEGGGSNEPTKGYRVKPDGSGWEPIPGGPAEIAIAARRDAAAAKTAAQEAAAAQKAQAAGARQAAAAEASNQLVDSIDGLLKSPGFGKLGTVTGDLEISTPYIRNDAKDANEQLHNIAGQVALTTMSRLKALSAQGATGFGSLSGPELHLLQNSIAALQADKISNAQLKTSLSIIRNTMAKVSGWKPQQQGGSAPRITTQAQFDALPSGATYISPDDGQPHRKP